MKGKIILAICFDAVLDAIRLLFTTSSMEDPSCKQGYMGESHKEKQGYVGQTPGESRDIRGKDTRKSRTIWGKDTRGKQGYMRLDPREKQGFLLLENQGIKRNSNIQMLLVRIKGALGMRKISTHHIKPTRRGIYLFLGFKFVILIGAPLLTRFA